MRLPTMLLVLGACGGVEGESPAAWSIDHATTEGALLGVWGSGPHDVWAVGGQVDRSLVLRGDGTQWQRFAAPGDSLLSNIYGFSDSDVYAVGERGLILHFDGESWTRIESGTDLPLFGLWGASGQDVWIVGGKHPTPVVLRGNRDGFQPVALPADLAPSVVFKAHGFAADDVILVGTAGVLRWNGYWRREPLPTTSPLFSTWGTGPHDVYAVGGGAVGEILHCDGRTWSTVAELPIGSSFRGVFTSLDGPTIAVSANGFAFEIDRAGTLVQAALPQQAHNLHGVWGDGLGTTYVVGGDFSAYPGPMSGVMFRRH